MSDEDKHPHPLEALRAYVEGLEAQEHDYRARGDDASRRLLSNQAHAARHALALATEAFAAVERERDEARRKLHETGRTVAMVSRNYATVEAQTEADRAALVTVVDLYRKAKGTAGWPEIAHRQDRLLAAIEAAEARLAGAPPPVAQGYAVDGPSPRRFVVDGWTSKDTSEVATLKEARVFADMWRDAFGGTVRPLAEQAEPSQASHRDMGARQREALDKLRKAIHFTTDDRDDGAPSTPAEHALLALQRACETRDWDATNDAAACLCETLADESRALRLAAAAVFGDEFRRKGDPR